jgi:predicted N-acetyltransferase YhbS
MITFAGPAMLDDLAALRRVCFDEDEAYSGFYFSKRFTPDNTLVYVEQGRAVASLTLLPVTIVTPVRNFQAAYVYAVATLPGFRRRGIASALLEHAETVLRARGGEALLLVPASAELRDYYARYGYCPCSGRREVVLEIDAIAGCDAQAHRVDVGPLEATELLRLRNAAYAPGGYFVQWDEAALCYAIEECYFCGGFTRLLRADTEEGFFMAYPKYGGVVIKESMLTERLFPYALQLIRKYFEHAKHVYFYLPQHAIPGNLPAGDGETEPFAMLKCLIPAAQPAAAAIPYFGLALD